MHALKYFFILIMLMRFVRNAQIMIGLVFSLYLCDG